MTLQNNKDKILVSVLFVVCFILLYNLSFTTSYSYDSNYANVTIDTTVNITNSKPKITAVIISEGVGAFETITLSAGRTRQIHCNATIVDWDGYGDINSTNATFWDDNNADMSSPDDNNNHYFNSSCSFVKNTGLYTAVYKCTLKVYYYANNGSNWVCNVTTVDDYYFSKPNTNYTDSLSNTTTLSALYAINLSNTLLDYGDVAVEDYSSEVSMDVVNFGNMAVNISVSGYAETPGDGLAMTCSLNGNISLDNERYTINSGTAFGSMTQLTGTDINIGGVQIAHQILDGTPVTNSTYWKLYIDPTNVPAGICNGTIVFSATIP
ncbi:MAG: hypothetical protein ABIC91_02625 [Nanoarchaeota archaeon]|nr:hypothetical protein [Nanoarchaeota archaeon]MBU1029848.1 hypothetical protein [Nanoarchaeota archaeon]MBU1849426.1 hypothetical protein [Nanoarchaeota archaeon]